MDYQEKCEAILEWADDHPNFDTTFVESILSQIEGGRDLSESQEDAINTIIERWHIEV